MGSSHILQVETFMGERALALQRQQQTRFVLNRGFPGVGMGAHGGTGVFLPRISSNMVTATVTKKHNPRSAGKGPRMNNLPPRKLLLNRRQQEYRGYAAAEVRTPNNWNY
ncbi:hypothetical protein DH2020_018226 [Rehmannia glutinosa]|uniref:Uncharacterized protein n=1 Tax=Rehmannia glutinosa TaxID=99300 RepID=A0ABR0WLR8_REHGL